MELSHLCKYAKSRSMHAPILSANIDKILFWNSANVFLKSTLHFDAVCFLSWTYTQRTHLGLTLTSNIYLKFCIISFHKENLSLHLTEDEMHTIMDSFDQYDVNSGERSA